MELFEAIRTRRSVGLAKGRVSETVLRELIEAATWAPNHRLTEPWRFTIVNGEVLQRLGERLAELENDPRHKQKLARSPAVIVVSYVVHEKPEIALEDRDATAAALQNLLLAAHALGLGAIWRTGAYVSSKHFAQLIALPANEQIIGVVAIGEQALQPVTQARNVAAVTRTLTVVP
jgi:nitroreductase